MRKSVLPILLLMVAGCTVNSGPVRPPELGVSETTAQLHPKAPRPADRDARAVTVALRGIDPCRLLSPYVQRHPEAGAIPNGPHSCLLSPKKDYLPGVDGLTLSIGEESDHASRYGSKPIVVDGAKAYVLDGSDGESSSCELTIPVSFTRGVTLKYRVSGRKDTCAVAQSLAKDVIAGLRDPDKIAVDPAKRPFSAWDGCSFTAALLGHDAQKYRYHPNGSQDPFSGCVALEDLGPTTAPGPGPVLEVEYAQWATAGSGEMRQIAGKDMRVFQGGRGCQVSWKQGDSMAGNTWLADQVFKISATDCDLAVRLAEQAVGLAGGRAGDTDAKPQRPLLYASDEPDVAPAGACRDFATTSGEDCQPYQRVSAPRGTDRVMAASVADKNVQCAVFGDLVNALLGAELAPVTWAAYCVFVEPAHTLIVTVDIDPADAPADYGYGNLYTERRVTELAGKQTVTFYDAHKSSYEIYLSPYNDIARRGNLHLRVEARPARGAGHLIEVPLDPATAARAEEIMTDAAQMYCR